jgi:Tol biopolymer transport system component
VFSSTRTGNRTLWTADGDRDFTHAAPLTTGVAIDERPVYSPDGQQIAFVSDRGGKRGVWTVSAGAGALRQIATADVVDTLSWSPDGRRLVFSTPIGDSRGLMIVDATSGAMTRVPTPAAAAAPAWSPHADVIAYLEPRGGGIGTPIRFVTSTGQPLYEQLLGYADGPIPPEQPSISNGMLAWSPDGRRLAAASLPGGMTGTVWMIEPEGGTAYRKLLDLPPGVFLRGLTWSRDGSSLIVGRVQQTGDIFLAERLVRP